MKKLLGSRDLSAANKRLSSAAQAIYLDSLDYDLAARCLINCCHGNSRRSKLRLIRDIGADQLIMITWRYRPIRVVSDICCQGKFFDTCSRDVEQETMD